MYDRDEKHFLLAKKFAIQLKYSAIVYGIKFSYVGAYNYFHKKNGENSPATSFRNPQITILILLYNTFRWLNNAKAFNIHFRLFLPTFLHSIPDEYSAFDKKILSGKHFSVSEMSNDT